MLALCGSHSSYWRRYWQLRFDTAPYGKPPSRDRCFFGRSRQIHLSPPLRPEKTSCRCRHGASTVRKEMSRLVHLFLPISRHGSRRRVITHYGVRVSPAWMVSQSGSVLRHLNFASATYTRVSQSSFHTLQLMHTLVFTTLYLPLVFVSKIQ